MFRLQEAAEILIGTWDFANFRNAACQAKNSTRTLDSVHSVETGDVLWITFQAKSFLHRQVRMMTGAMVQFSTHAIQRSEFLRYLDVSQKTKPLAAPAHGLFLKKIIYSPSIF